MTLGEELREARQAATDAEQAFHDLLREASDRGASTREIAALLDVPHTTVWRWIGRPAPERRRVLEEAR